MHGLPYRFRSFQNIVLMGAAVNLAQGIAGVLVGVTIDSVTLTAFGVDSLIMIAVSVVTLNRTSGRRGIADTAITLVAFGAATSFLLLAAAIVVMGPHIYGLHEPEGGSLLGPIVAMSAVCINSALTALEHLASEEARTPAMRDHLRQSVAGSAIPAVLGVGIIGITLGWYAFDIAAALAMVPMVLWQSYSSFRAAI